MTVSAVIQIEVPLPSKATTKNWLAPAYIEQDKNSASQELKPNCVAETPKAKETGR